MLGSELKMSSIFDFVLFNFRGIKLKYAPCKIIIKTYE